MLWLRLQINMKHQFPAVTVLRVAVDVILNTTQFHLLLLMKLHKNRYHLYLKQYIRTVYMCNHIFGRNWSNVNTKYNSVTTLFRRFLPYTIGFPITQNCIFADNNNVHHHKKTCMILRIDIHEWQQQQQHSVYVTASIRKQNMWQPLGDAM